MVFFIIYICIFSIMNAIDFHVWRHSQDSHFFVDSDFVSILFLFFFFLQFNSIPCSGLAILRLYQSELYVFSVPRSQKQWQRDEGHELQTSDEHFCPRAHALSRWTLPAAMRCEELAFPWSLQCWERCWPKNKLERWFYSLKHWHSRSILFEGIIVALSTTESL